MLSIKDCLTYRLLQEPQKILLFRVKSPRAAHEEKHTAECLSHPLQSKLVKYTAVTDSKNNGILSLIVRARKKRQKHTNM